MPKFLTAVDAIKAYRAGSLTADNFLCYLYQDSRARYIVKVVVRKTGVRPSLSEELFQESVLVIYKLLDKIDEPEGFYSFWYTIAWRSSQTIRRLYPSREILDSQRSENQEPGEEDRISAEEADTSLLPLDEGSATAFARSKFSEKLAEDLLHREIVAMTTKTKKPRQVVGFVSNSVQQGVIKVETKKKKPRTDLSPEQAELAAIRGELGIKIDDYALALNIPRDRLTSYLYGRANVPAEVLISARELRYASSANSDYPQKIKTLFSDWRNRLSITQNDDVKLAAALGITVERLRAIESGKEPITSLQTDEFNKLVERFEVFLA